MSSDLTRLHPADRQEAEEALSMLACPYYRGVGTCESGCRSEPACRTCEPTEGWRGVLDGLGGRREA